MPSFRRISHQTRQPLIKIQVYITYTIKYPVTNFLSHHQLSPDYFAFLTTISNTYEQKDFLETQSQAVWQHAINEELTTLAESHT